MNFPSNWIGRADFGFEFYPLRKQQHEFAFPNTQLNKKMLFNLKFVVVEHGA